MAHYCFHSSYFIIFINFYFCIALLVYFFHIHFHIITKQMMFLSPYQQEALLERLGKNAVAFSIDINTLAPPSVQLLPAKRYSGAPIGTSYDIRIFTGE